MSKLAILHTTPATLDPLKALAAELLPGVGLINILDDSILPQLINNGGNLDEVSPRWFEYVRSAYQAGANVIMSACSSVGELVPPARSLVPVPVLRIDEPMAEQAVQMAETIGVAATLATTLAPTTRLLEKKAADARRTVTLETMLVSEAYQRLQAGDRAGHDAILADGLCQLAGRTGVVVLAQASMARAVSSLPPALQEKFLTSPRSGMQQVVRIFT